MKAIAVYLAGRFSRQHELREYAADLQRSGVTVTARWLTGVHDWTGGPDEQIPVADQGRFAQDDLDDIDAADVLVFFGDPPGGYGARGGACVELGYAYARGTTIIIVGHRQNVFCCLPDVIYCADPQAALAYVRGLHVGSNGRVKAA